MDKKSNFPAEVVGDLRRIHSVMTRALKVSIEHSHSFSLKESVEPSETEGFILYARCLASMIHSHHISEDDLAFPYFKDKLADFPHDTLSAQHREMTIYLEEINNSIERIENSGASKEELENLKNTFKLIQKIWMPHIRIEETHISEDNVGTVLDMKERIRIGGLISKNSQKHQKAGIIMLPFILYNMEPGDREVMLQAFPWFLRRIVVPLIIKKRWFPMKPYLLYN